MRDSSRTLVADIVIGVIAGLVATKVTDWAQAALYSVTPAKVREKEKRVRPGPPGGNCGRGFGEPAGRSNG